MKIFLTLFVLFFSSSVVAGKVVGGIVVLDHYDCNSYDHVVIETSMGYTLAEVYSGYSAIIEGKTIYGEFHSFGFTSVYNKNNRKVGKLWIDDYYSSKSSAIEWCQE